MTDKSSARAGAAFAANRSKGIRVSKPTAGARLMVSIIAIVVVWVGRAAHLAGVPCRPRVSVAFINFASRTTAGPFSVYCDANLVGILKKSPEDWMGHSTMMRTMRYQCDQARGRCWQEEHVARLGTFDAAFAAGRAPRRFGFTDVDGQVERNGCLLVLELKTPGAPLPAGQRIMYEQATRRMGDAYRPYVIWGAPDFSGPLEFQTWRGGRTTGRQPIALTELQARFTNWYRWADRQDVAEGVVR